MRTESFFGCNAAVIKDDTVCYSANSVESPDDRITETFFILAVISQDNRPAAEAQPGTEKMDTFLFSMVVDLSFTPVDLDRFSGVKLKRNKNPWKLGTDLPDFPTDRRFAAGESSLFDQTVIDSFCRMFLFPETRSFIFLKAGTDKSRDIILDDR